MNRMQYKLSKVIALGESAMWKEWLSYSRIYAYQMTGKRSAGRPKTRFMNQTEDIKILDFDIFIFGTVFVFFLQRIVPIPLVLDIKINILLILIHRHYLRLLLYNKFLNRLYFALVKLVY